MDPRVIGLDEDMPWHRSRSDFQYGEHFSLNSFQPPLITVGF